MPSLELPAGKTSAFVISFDFDAEEVWLAENPENANRPGVLSQGTYGAKVGVGLVLDTLDHLGLPATFFTPGRVAERYPDQMREIVAHGHELGHHGYTHTSPTKLSKAEELEELLKGKAALEQFGVEVTGYRSPSWEVSPNTFDLLVENGFKYSSSMMDDIKPYVHPAHKVVELPVQWMLDDAPYFWFSVGSDWNRTIRSARDVEEIWREEFMGIHGLGGLTMLTMHPQFIGRPSRVAMLERFLTFVKSHDEVWIATAGEVAKAVK